MYVPTQEVGVLDATFVLSNGAPWDHFEETLDAAAAKPEMEGVFANVKEELVSSDYRNEMNDCNVDFNSSLGTSDTFVKLVAWFDGEGTKFRQALKLVQKMAHLDKRNVKRVNKGPTPGKMLFDELALTEATPRAKAVSLDAGRPKQVSFDAATGAHVPLPVSGAHSGNGSASGAPKILVNGGGGGRRRETSPGVILKGEFGLKEVVREEDPEVTPAKEEATPEGGGGDGAGSKRASMV